MERHFTSRRGEMGTAASGVKGWTRTRVDRSEKRSQYNIFMGARFIRNGGGWSAAGGRIAVVLSEDTGNIWFMSRAGDR